MGRVIHYACLLQSAYELNKIEDVNERNRQALIEFGGKLTLLVRLKRLVNDLRDASSSGDAVGVAAVAKICGP
jgi:hypothetical protein